MRNQKRLLKLQKKHGEIHAEHHVPGESFYCFDDGFECTFGENDIKEKKVKNPTFKKHQYL